MSEPYIEEWKDKIINELQSTLKKEEHIQELNLNIKNGFATIEYSVKKFIPLELKMKKGK